MALQKQAPVAGAPESCILRAAVAAGTMSQRIWGLDWAKVLPWSFDDATCERGTFEDALPFMQEHYPSIFGVDSERFFIEGMTGAKRRFGDEMDVFVFRSKGTTVGIALAHPTDWATYYVRTLAFLPEYRERGWASDFAAKICEPLREAGCDRWEAECSPANTAMMRLLVRQGFLITGTVNSERWGHMTRFTRFLRKDAENAFRRQFVSVPNFGRHPPHDERRTP
jgi:ribosomal protein S18 acetylase RimI-like enzyme